jgi:hypothetical protein
MYHYGIKMGRDAGWYRQVCIDELKFAEDGSNNQFNGTGWGFMVPQKKLYDAFVQEEGVDGYRLNQTMKTYDQISQLGVKVAKGQSLINEGYFMWKRRFSNVESPAGFWCSYNNYRWMRYAEVLLLAAEANLKDGNQSEADACLNEVRQRARLDAKTATLDAIKLEKRLELCSEYTRYQDIIRWKDAEALLQPPVTRLQHNASNDSYYMNTRTQQEILHSRSDAST